mmetsp:Transcript_13183/g.20526  ORF Transcript_13183/g.20526 Transcript_13183/m.20526 type:complete len:259 (-) Transcript_13183:1513-2289(-)
MVFVQGLLVVLNGLLGLLDVHEGLGSQLEVVHGRVRVEDLEVASLIVHAVLELVQVELGLLLLGLDEADVVRSDLLEHSQPLLDVTHLEGHIRLGEHHLDLLGRALELGDGSRHDLLGLVEVLYFAVHANNVHEYSCTLGLSVGKRVLLAQRRDHYRGVLYLGQVVGGLQSFKGGFPVFSADFDIGAHQHEDRVFTDLEILGEGLLEVEVSRFHVTALTVNDCSQNVGLHHGGVLLQAVVQLLEGGGGVVSQPLGLSQ